MADEKHPEKILEVNMQNSSSLPEKERTELERINKEWCEAFIEGFNSQDAAIIFALGATKKGKVVACATTDIPMAQIVAHLEAYVTTLKKGLEKK